MRLGMSRLPNSKAAGLFRLLRTGLTRCLAHRSWCGAMNHVMYRVWADSQPPESEPGAYGKLRSIVCVWIF